MNGQINGKAWVFGGLVFLGAALVGTALLLPGWAWLKALFHAGFINPGLMFLGLSLYALAWLVPVVLILDRTEAQ